MSHLRCHLLLVAVVSIGVLQGRAEELPYIELTSPRFAGGSLDDVGAYAASTSFAVFSPDSQSVAAIRGSQVFLWRVPKGELLWHQALPRRAEPRVIRGVAASLYERGQGIAFSPDGRRLAVASDFPTSIYVWQLTPPPDTPTIGQPDVLAGGDFAKLIPAAEWQSIHQVQLKWYSDSDLLIHLPGRLFRARFTDSPELRLLQNTPAGLISVESSDNEGRTLNLLAYKTHRGVGIQAIASQYRESLGRFEQQTPPRITKLMYLTASPQWPRFAGVNRTSQALGVFDARSGKTHTLGDVETRWSAHMAWSSDGQLLATATDMREGALVLWEVPSGKRIADVGLPHPLGELEVGSFAPDNRYLITADGPNTRNSGSFQLWDVDGLRRNHPTNQ